MELALRMTPAMGAIYDAITDLMDACLKELRRSNKVLTIRHIHLYVVASHPFICSADHAFISLCAWLLHPLAGSNPKNWCQLCCDQALFRQYV